MNALVQQLLGHPLVHLATVRRNTNDDWVIRAGSPALQYGCRVEHGLHERTDRADVVRGMLHVDKNTVGDRVACFRGEERVGRDPGAEHRFALFQERDHPVERPRLRHRVRWKHRRRQQ